MSSKLRLTPWSCREEWEEVRNLFMARDKKCLEYLAVWTSRVARLPAGVETSHSLMLSLANPTPMSLATGVNRFLNHISHLAMNMWPGLSKLHKAAEYLAVPEWMVDLRHETTHGSMPSTTLLWTGLQFGLSWLDRHYWSEARPVEAGEGLEEHMTKVLECYMYVKLYQVWGTNMMSELVDQKELFSHLQELWAEVKGGRSHKFAGLSVKQAVGIVKTELINLCEEEVGLEMLARLLVEQELLVPDKEFRSSLGEEEGVPRQLVQVWSEMINFVDRGLGVKVLVDHLMSRLSLGGDGSDLIMAWVELLAECMTGKVNKLLNITRVGVGKKCLEKWLDNPSIFVVNLCPMLCQLAGLSEKDTDKVVQLVRLAVGDNMRGQSVKVEDFVVHTEKELILNGDINDVSEVGWTEDSQHCWDNVRLGGWEGQSWSDLWLTEGDWEGEDVEEECCVPDFVIGDIDWSSAKGFKQKTETDTDIPHFYRNTGRSPDQRHKRFRRN